MDDFKYEEGYFKLKKSNDELATLLTKVLSDLKASKLALKTEKDKNEAANARITYLTTEFENVNTSYEEQKKKVHDLTQELEYLRTYSKAVEGVAENYCGQNISTQNKYHKLKRQSTMLLSKLGDHAEIFNFDELNDAEDCTDNEGTPTPLVEMEKIKKNHSEILKRERQRYDELRQENLLGKSRISCLKNEINDLNSKLEKKHSEVTQVNSEMEILISSHSILKDDHERMLNLFSPVLQLKSENQDLKRTSALLMGNIDGDERITEFIKIVNELKSEIKIKDQKILELKKESDEHTFSEVTIQMTGLRAELEDMAEQLAAVRKEKEKLLHENRILVEQRAAYQVAPPPPSLAPPPPPSSKLMGIFKKSKGKALSQSVSGTLKPKAENQLVCDLMHELEQRLLQKVKNKMKEEKKPSCCPQTSIDVTDSDNRSPDVMLRSKSVPTINIPKKEINDLQNMFKKFHVLSNENE